MAVVASNPVDYNTFEKLVASQNGGPLPDLHSFYKYVIAQPNGEADLSALAATTATRTTASNGHVAPAAPTALSGFSQQTSATASVINLWIYQRVYVNALGKQCTINMGGITPGFPGGATFGTLFYNNAADINGDCDVAFAGLGPYFALYFRRNGDTFATYQSGGVSWATGVAGGTGTWA